MNDEVAAREEKALDGELIGYAAARDYARSDPRPDAIYFYAETPLAVLGDEESFFPLDVAVRVPLIAVREALDHFEDCFGPTPQALPRHALTLHKWDDWALLVVDGKIVNEGHDIPQFELLDLFEELYGAEVAVEWHEGVDDPYQDVERVRKEIEDGQ